MRSPATTSTRVYALVAGSTSLRFIQVVFVGCLLSALMTGCSYSCQTTCKKVLACDGLETSRIALEECTEECVRQGALYEAWENESKEDAFDAHKQCLNQRTCDEIIEGECYDEELFQF